MFKNKRKIIILIVSLLILLLISIISISCMGMGSFTNAEDTANQGIETFEVQRGDIFQLISTEGSVDSDSLNTYTLQGSGRIISALEKGDSFKEGDILVEVDNSEGLLQLEKIEKNLQLSEISLKTAKSNYRSALDANHIAVQLKDLNTKKAEESTNSALSSLENANKNAELSYQSAERALEEAEEMQVLAQQSDERALKEAKEMLALAQDDPATTEMQLAQYESNVESAEEKLESTLAQYESSVESADENLESTDTSNDYSESQAESSYNQSLLSQSTTYWNNLSSIQSAEAQIGSTLRNINQAEIQLDLAKIDYEEAKKNLDEYILYASYDGVIFSSDFKIGNDNAGASMISIISNDFLVKSTIGETDISKVTAGDEVYISLDAYPDQQFLGAIEKIIPIAVEESNIISFEISIKLNDLEGAELYYGLSASVDIVIEKAEDILYVPIQAVYTENGKSYVDILVSEQIDSENMEQSVKKMEVTTGINDYSYIEITSGLKEGDIIVTSRI